GAPARVAGQAVQHVPPVAVGRLAVAEERKDVDLPVEAPALPLFAVVDVADELVEAVLVAEAPVQRKRYGGTTARRGEVPEHGRHDQVRVVPVPPHEEER